MGRPLIAIVGATYPVIEPMHAWASSRESRLMREGRRREGLPGKSWTKGIEPYAQNRRAFHWDHGSDAEERCSSAGKAASPSARPSHCGHPLPVTSSVCNAPEPARWGPRVTSLVQLEVAAHK